MKQKDIILIVGVAVVSGVVAWFLSSKLIVTPSHRQQQVEVVQTINTQFNQPDKAYFNSQSIDPTKLIQIGNNANSQPFNSTQQ